ncbi:hypothetical protein GGQ86_002966 [Xanthobacter flavus]|uniref:Tip attachment protein J domain-containing protein n=1 Tax=Xanthobacter flavus TaxID=281 RepID=A0A9W6CNX0_XANFL|nr:phage tail protein [Xanthobacter flavus]MDR6334484.1 hypothetical protein [Xanthobacter flavus]GLI23496.1 hypothetical protein XFLAVUS301_31700 [Xanthobacter flavus]
MRHDRPPEGVPVYSVAYGGPFIGAYGQRYEAFGPTIGELVATTPGLPKHFERHGDVQISGNVIPREHWHRVRPRPSLDPEHPTYVTFHLRPRGSGDSNGGDSSKSIIGVVAALALVVATAGIASIGIPGIIAGGTFGAQLAAGAVGLVGSLAIGALTAPPSEPDTNRKTKNKGTASASGNLIDPGEPLPRVLGTFRVFPALITDPFYQVIGQDEFVSIVGALAGPHKLEAIRIGDADIEDADDLEYETREGWSGDAPLTLVDRQVRITGASGEVSGHALDPDNVTKLEDQTTPANSIPKWQTVATRKAPDRARIRLDFPQGIGTSNPDNENALVLMPFRFRIRPRGGTGWINLPEVMFSSRRQPPKKGEVIIDWGTEPAVPDPPGNKGWVYAYRTVPAQTVAPIGLGGWAAHSYFSDPSKTQPYLSSGTTAASGVLHTHMTGDSVTFYLDPDLFPKTTYEIQYKRGCLIAKQSHNLTSYSYSIIGVLDYFGYQTTGGAYKIPNDDDFFGSAYFIRCQSEWDQHPVQMAGDALIAIRAKNRAIENVSVLASGWVPDLDALAGPWVTTSNPAYHYRFVLAGSLNADPIEADLIDEDALLDWRNSCAAEGYTCDAIVQGSSIQETLTLIGSCGYARPTQSEVWGVYEDRDRSADAPVQVFSPRNSANFKWERAFARLPDGFRVTYSDKSADFEQQQIVVMREGATGANLENVTYSGIVTEPQAVARARFDLAQAVARGTYYYFDAPAEAIVCRRGDLIGLTHDVLTRQAGSARVKAKITSGGNVTGLVLDAAIYVTAASFGAITDMSEVDSLADVGVLGPVGIIIRRQDGTFSTHRITEGMGWHETVTLQTPVPDATVTVASGWDTEAVPAIGEAEDGSLIFWGPVDEETKRLLVFGVTPNEDLTFSIVAVDEAPDLVRTAAGTFDAPGSQIYDHDGAFYFVVPNYETSLTVTLVGASAGSHGITNTSTFPAGTAGGDTTFDGMVAGGSQVPANRLTAGLGGVGSGAGSGSNGNAGGVPTGTTATGKGGDAVGTTGTGGAAVTANGNGLQGTAPGAGASGAYRTISSTPYLTSGTGSGARRQRTYARGDLVPGTVMAVVVGAAGAGGVGGVQNGGAGQRGEASFSWS